MLQTCFTAVGMVNVSQGFDYENETRSPFLKKKTDPLPPKKIAQVNSLKLSEAKM